jgi:transposase
VIDATHLGQLTPQQLRETVLSLAGKMASQAAEIERKDGEIAFRQALIDKLTHEMAVLKRLKFAAQSEAYNAEQKSLLEETIDTDLAALAAEIEQAEPPPGQDSKRKPKRQALPENLPRREISHEPENTTCGCGCQLKRIGQDVAEKLDYQPGVFTVERHIRGKWVCAKCETLVQAPVPAHVIDKGLPTAGLLAQVLVAKYADHLPLYRQEAIFGRAGLALPRSTLAQWVGQCGVQLQPLVDALRNELLKHTVLHADETPVAMLKPGAGKTHRAYLWSYCTTSYNQTKAVVFDFADSRGGQHARDFLGLPGADGWHGSLVCDDFSGYKACFEMGVTEAGCLAHARRKFHELWVNHQSTIGERALKFFIQLYEVERDVRELDAAQRKRIRQERARPVADALHLWLIEHRKKVPEGSATAKAMDYSLGRWQALTRYIDDGELPADNNWVENQIRPIATGRKNWLFAGSLRAGQRAAAVMSLVHSAKLNGHDLRILEGHPGAAAHAAGKPRPRAAAPLLADLARDYLTLRAVVKTGSPRAYSAGSLWAAAGGGPVKP